MMRHCVSQAIPHHRLVVLFALLSALVGSIVLSSSAFAAEASAAGSRQVLPVTGSRLARRPARPVPPPQGGTCLGDVLFHQTSQTLESQTGFLTFQNLCKTPTMGQFQLDVQVTNCIYVPHTALAFSNLVNYSLAPNQSGEIPYVFMAGGCHECDCYYSLSAPFRLSWEVWDATEGVEVAASFGKLFAGAEANPFFKQGAVAYGSLLA
jgi:hypothetical protein